MPISHSAVNLSGSVSMTVRKLRRILTRRPSGTSVGSATSSAHSSERRKAPAKQRHASSDASGVAGKACRDRSAVAPRRSWRLQTTVPTCYQVCMRTIAIASRKGGAGKTTMATHLAVAAEASGLRVALFELDPLAIRPSWRSIPGSGTGAGPAPCRVAGASTGRWC